MIIREAVTALVITGQTVSFNGTVQIRHAGHSVYVVKDYIEARNFVFLKDPIRAVNKYFQLVEVDRLRHVKA